MSNFVRASEIDINMYSFDLTFYGSIDDLNKTSFVLTSAYNSYVVNDHDSNRTGFEALSLYSDIIVGEEDYVTDDYGQIIILPWYVFSIFGIVT